MEINNRSGALNEYFTERHFCATPDGRGNQNVCPEKEMTSSAAEMKRNRKDRGLNLRKSLAWNSAFFTEEGVLDPSELSKITGSVTKASSQLPSKTTSESSSMMKFDKFSKRPPLQNLEENLLRKHQARSVPRSSTKMTTKLLPISEASSHDEPQMSMISRKPDMKGINKDVPKLDPAFLLEKGKSVMRFEKDASTLKLNYCPSSTNRLHVEMNCSASTRTMSSAIKKAHNFHGLPPAPIQAKHSASRMPSLQGRVEKPNTMKPLFEKGQNLLKPKSCPSSSAKSPMLTTCFGSTGKIPSFPQQTFNSSKLPPPIESKPSALRMPSPSLGFFQQKTVISSPSNQLHKISQVPISGIPFMRRPTKLTHSALSKLSVAQTEQKFKKGTVPTNTNLYPGKSRNTAIFLIANDSKLTCTDFEARIQDMEIKHIDTNETISSNVCGSPNCQSNTAIDNLSSCLSEMDEKTQDVIIRKHYNGRAKELTEEVCSISQISSDSLSEGSGMVGRVVHSNDFESTSGPIQHSIGFNTTEVCSTSSEMYFPRNLDESNSKQIHVCAPFINDDLIIDKDKGVKPDVTFADSSKENISSDGSESVSNLGCPCIKTSEKAGMHIEPRKELSEEFDIQTSEEHLHEIISQVQQAILEKIPTIEEHGNSSLDVQLAASEKCQPQVDLQLRELRNETISVQENGFITANNVSLDILKQVAIPLKHQLSSIPYSEEWLAAIEAFGEDILEVKTGTVHNSPPEKAIPEPGPWSPVKQKAQDVGPFDCTKYCKKPAPAEE